MSVVKDLLALDSITIPLNVPSMIAACTDTAVSKISVVKKRMEVHGSFRPIEILLRSQISVEQQV